VASSIDVEAKYAEDAGW